MRMSDYINMRCLRGDAKLRRPDAITYVILAWIRHCGYLENESGIRSIMNIQVRPQLTRFILLGLVLWGVFTLYAGSLTQTTLYDDPGIMKYLADRTVVSVFGI